MSTRTGHGVLPAPQQNRQKRKTCGRSAGRTHSNTAPVFQTTSGSRCATTIPKKNERKVVMADSNRNCADSNGLDTALNAIADGEEIHADSVHVQHDVTVTETEPPVSPVLLDKAEEPAVDKNSVNEHSLMEFHPIANTFPLPSEDALDEMLVDVDENGQIEPVRVYEGKILDGRGMAIVCQRLGIQPKTEEYTDGNPLEFVTSKNLKRRHLTLGQRAAIGVEVANMPRHRPKISPKSLGLISQKAAAKQLKVSSEYIRQAGKVRTDAPKVFDALKAGAVDLPSALRITKFTVKGRKMALGMIAKGVKVVDAIRDTAQAELKAKLDDIAAQKVKEIEGVFDVIVIDPPWEMEKVARKNAPHEVGWDYHTMTEERLRKMRIPAADVCHVWLWTTHKHLPIALSLLKEWGLEYVCIFVWHKNGGMQTFGRPKLNCEFALYARKGNPQFIDLKAFNACFEAPRGAHSEKPEAFYDMVKRVTAGRRLDMFNRRKIEGFEGWGLESPGNLDVLNGTNDSTIGDVESQ